MKTRIKNLLLLLLLLGLPGVVQAQDAYSTNADGSIYTYSTNADGSANIVAYAGPPWVVTIPTNINGLTVTSIGEDAFLGDSLPSVTIPGSVTSIGEFAFGNCFNLTNATIDNGVTSIGDDAFYYCANLTSLTVPDSVASIGANAFEMDGLTNVTIPNSVTSIGAVAFGACDRLPSVTIPASVTNIGTSAFSGCTSLTNITVDASNSAYSSTNGVLFDKAQATLLQCPAGLGGSYTIPNSVTGIGTYAFGGCAGLTGITIPNGVTSIGDSAFGGTSLTSVTIPGSVTSIGDYAFGGTSLTSVTIPNSVTNIGDYAFESCISLSSATIGNSVTSIGDSVFYNCTHLIIVTIPNSVTSIGNDAFVGCDRLPSVTIPNRVTNIGDGAFANCNSLTGVTIPNSVTSIGNGAFAGCIGLTSVTIPGSVTSIGERAFDVCTSLTAITVDTNNPAYTSLNGVLFNKSQTTLVQYPGGLVGSYTIPGSVTSIGDYAFFEDFFYEDNLTSVTIPGSVTSIGAYAFAYAFGYNYPHSVYFTGNAPSPTNDSTVFSGDYNTTVYYLPGTTGWGAMFDDYPTAPWFLPNPVILNNSAGFGVQPGGFGFTISWATNASVVVQAATNLANPVWIPVSTSPLTSGTNYFSDPQWTNYPERFYRVTSAFTVGGTLTGLPAGDTVTLQDNGSDNLTLSNNGTFTFPTALPDGQAYSVTVSGTSGGKPISCTLTSGSGTISGANVTNIAAYSGYPALTGNRDLDMYNAAVWDGTANGGVPGVMFTENGGPFRVTAEGRYSDDIARTYSGWAVFTHVVGTFSCSSTTFPTNVYVIQFGTVLNCGSPPRY